jgi:translation initiation factor 1 (eIF-1/SUI1)
MNHITKSSHTLIPVRTLTLTPHSGNTLAGKGMKKDQNHSNASQSSIHMSLKSPTAGKNATNPRDQSSAESADISSIDDDATSDESDDEVGALVIDDEDESLSDIFSLNMDSLSKRVSKVHIFVRPGKRRRKITTIEGLSEVTDFKAMIRSLKKRQNCGGSVQSDAAGKRSILQLEGDQSSDCRAFLLEQRLCEKDQIVIHCFI